MKNIHDILAAYEITVPDDKKVEFDKALLENYKTIADYEKQGEKLRLAEDKVETTEKALKQFEGVDIDALQGKIATLQTDLANKDTEYQGKIADMAFNASLSAAVSAAKGKNVKAISAMLDMDTLRASKNQEADIKAALDALKESDVYLFETETPPPYASGTGTNNMATPPADVFQEKVDKYSKI